MSDSASDRDLQAAAPSRRIRRAMWSTVAFLAGFVVLIAVVSHYYLLPALDAARSADPAGRRQLSAFSILLLTIVLFTVLVGLGMIFRVRRFFFPRANVTQPTRTEHVDAWRESGKRMTTPVLEDDSQDDD